MRFFRQNKYNAVAKVVDGIRFSSLAEAELYELLKADKDTLHIDCHIPVSLPGGLRFNLDFIVWKKDSDSETGLIEAIECKGFETEVFKKLRKVFDDFHPLSPLKVFRKEGNRWVNL